MSLVLYILNLRFLYNPSWRELYWGRGFMALEFRNPVWAGATVRLSFG